MKYTFHFRSGAGATLVAALAAVIALSVQTFDAQGQTLPAPAERPVHLLKAETRSQASREVRRDAETCRPPGVPQRSLPSSSR